MLRNRRGGRRGRLVALLAAVVVLAVAGWAVFTYVVQPRQAVTDAAEDVDRVDDVFDIPEGERPDGAVPGDGGSTTFLIVGSDARGEAQDPTDDGEWQAGEQRSDVIMLGRVTPDGEVALVSVPRDSWVEIPGHGFDKINAAYSEGGPQLLVRTLEQLTGVRIDHFAAADFEGLVSLTDTVGGVTVDSPRESSYQGHHFVQGKNHLTGEEALAFVRQRKNLPRGDLDRVENQQRFLRALFGQIVSRETATNPQRLQAVLDGVMEHVAVDAGTDEQDLRAIATALGGTPSDQVVAGTAPVAGLGMEGQQSVVYLDEEAGEQVWQALRENDIEALREALD